jgi:hypothetical protein
MLETGVVVVGETPSLAASLVELLEADGVSVVSVRELREAEALVRSGSLEPRPLVISASNRHYCLTARRWRMGSLKESELVVVGTRDPLLRSSGRLHVVPLPLIPEEFLGLVRNLAGRAADAAVPAAP